MPRRVHEGDAMSIQFNSTYIVKSDAFAFVGIQCSAVRMYLGAMTVPVQSPCAPDTGLFRTMKAMAL